MTSPLSGNTGQPGAGLTKDPGFGTDTTLGKQDNAGTGREDAHDLALSAAFSLQLASARAVKAIDFSDDANDLAVVAAAPPPPMALILGTDDGAEVDPAARRADIAALVDKLVTEVDTADRLRLGGSAPVTLTLPLNASALGLAEARLVAAKGELTVVFPMTKGADSAAVSAALGDLALALSQRFPNRTIRLRGEDQSHDGTDTEFNPFKEPIGRRK
jgi:hypothetical protein